MGRIGSEGTAIDKGTNYNWRARSEYGGGTVNATDAHGEKRIHEISLEHPTHIQKMIHIHVQPLGTPAEPKRLQLTMIRD
jgi:hypothetical protein